MAGQPARAVSEIAPSVGRVVHYVSEVEPAGVCFAALITQVTEPRGDPKVDLAVFTPSGVFFVLDKLSDGLRSAGTWHWPERM